MSAPSRNGAPAAYEAKHLEVLGSAAALFAERGFHKTSVRDLARATGRSLSGLYYYFSGKEELLFQIQNHCYSTLLSSVNSVLGDTHDPRERLVAFISHHLAYFSRNMDEMKVLAHEDLTLGGDYGSRLLEIKRRYSQILIDLVADYESASGRAGATSVVTAELAAFVLFGMMNWLYTWPRKLRGMPATDLAEAVAAIFMGGFPGATAADLQDLRGRIVRSASPFWEGATPSARNAS